jgi:hypothetical protein
MEGWLALGIACKGETSRMKNVPNENSGEREKVTE